MIEWMQHHKKYLVVTIWVSVIALVFAGMVGWNPSDFSLSGDNVAKVGNIKISQQEFQYAYQRTFNEYNQMLGGNLDAEQAKNFKLDDIALQQLIQKARLQNFALELGLRVEDNEVAETITKNEAFQDNGVFSEKIYREILKNNHLPIKFFEQSIRDSLLVQKLLELFPTSITSLEQQSIESAITLTDIIDYQILELQPLKQQVTQQQMQDFWEKNKNNYYNPPEVTLQVAQISIEKQEYTQLDLENFYNENKTLYLDSTGELITFQKAKEDVLKDYKNQKAKENALRLKTKFKKNQLENLKLKKTTIILDSHATQDVIEQLQNVKEEDVINPILKDNNYIVGKVVHYNPKRTKDFQEAYQEVLKDLKHYLQLKSLEEYAQKQTKIFKGKRMEINNLTPVHFEGIDDKKSQTIIRKIFMSSKKSDFIMLDNQAFLYRILEQKFPNKIPNNLIPLVQNIKSQYISQTLLNYVSKKYPTKIYNYQISQ